MITISAAEVKDNIFQLLSDVNEKGQPILIVNERGKNAVMIGVDDWRTIEESLFLMSIPGMTESIIKGGNIPLAECLSEKQIKELD